MSKTRAEAAVEIVVSLHEELYKSYNNRLHKDPTFHKELGEYVGEQFQHILNALKMED
ncbi:hypothetical protein ACXM1Q_000160 [Streptococcus sp. 10F2]